MRHQHYEAVDEQRVPDASQRIQTEDQQVDVAGDGNAEEQQMDADPPACTEQHDPARTEHLGQYTGGPSTERREQAIYSH